MPTTIMLPLERVYSSESKGRELQPEGVVALSMSMERLGLRVPISVRTVRRHRDGVLTDCWQLISGHHRVAAARKLRWTDIAAEVLDGDDLRMRLIEIADNLHRAELLPLERAEHIAEWIKLTTDQQKHDGKTLHNGAKLQGTENTPKNRASNKGRKVGGTRGAIRELNISAGTAARAKKIDGISPAAKELARTLKPTMKTLLDVAEVPPDQQVLALQQAHDGRKPTQQPARPKSGADEATKGFNRLSGAWKAASVPARERFIRSVDLTRYLERAA